MDPLKEYLVKLGFKVNNSQYEQFKKVLNLASSDVATFENVSISSMAAASVAILAFMAAANGAIASFIGNLAKADIQTELFARKMWVTVEQGRAIQTALKVMNADIEDIWFSPELRREFQEIQKTIQEVELPDDYRDQLQTVRNLQLEFMKLKVIFSYLSQWIGYYIIKYVSGPLSSVTGDVKDLNEYLKSNLPEISEKIGKFLGNFLRIGIAVYKALSGIVGMINDLPGEVKGALLAITALMSVFSGNPFMLAILGLSMLLLLLEDYYTYKQGGKSALGDMWKELEQSDKFSELKKTFDSLQDSLVEVIGTVDSLFSSLSKLFGIEGDSFLDMITTVTDFIADRLNNELQTLIFLLDTLNALITPTEQPKSYKFGYTRAFGDIINGTNLAPANQSNKNITIQQNFDNKYNIQGTDANAISRGITNDQYKQMIKTRNQRGIYD